MTEVSGVSMIWANDYELTVITPEVNGSLAGQSLARETSQWYVEVR